MDKGICGWVSVETPIDPWSIIHGHLNQHLINISTDIQSMIDWLLGWQLGDSQLIFADTLVIECWLVHKSWSTPPTINQPDQGSIEGIDWYSTMYAFSAHDLN